MNNSDVMFCVCGKSMCQLYFIVWCGLALPACLSLSVCVYGWMDGTLTAKRYANTVLVN
jgi:hypothetical protein